MQQMSQFLVTCTLLINLGTATKHSFITRNDARHLIGPIGGPFGFITGGVYNLTVYDFGLSLGKQTSKRHSFNINALQYFEAGFILQRFDSENDYSRYVNNMMEHEPPSCVYETHRHHDYVSVDPANYDDDQLQADDEFQINYDGDGNHHLENADSSGVFLSMNQPEKSWSPQSTTVTHSFTASEEGLYFLIFQLCSRDSKHNDDIEIRTSFELDLHYMNYDSFGNPSYLTAGEMVLPFIYIYFSFSYALMFFFWASNIRNIRLGRDHIWASREGEMSRPVVYAIHHLMTLLLGLKTITVFFEALRYYFIRIHGHAELLSTVYYIMSFIKGIFMFTVILLIGSGWSLVKSVLGDREKKIIWAVLILQVIDNIAIAVLSQETEGEKLYDNWSAVLHFVDILCCTAILVPIVWQVNSLEAIVQSKTEKSSNEVTDESKPIVITDIESEGLALAETARTLQKLNQFQRFYMLVLAYIYFTRIAVYVFATMLGYRLTWLRYFVTELGTLVFYSVVGILFRPMIENPYLKVSGTNNEEEMIEIART